jgi:uncharacterized protein (DUF1501 family)
VQALDRRRFLLQSSSALGAVLSTVVPSSTVGRSARRLLLLRLAGGNDGFATLVPRDDVLLPALRPNLWRRPDELLPVAQRWALHPRLPALRNCLVHGRGLVFTHVVIPTALCRVHERAERHWRHVVATTFGPRDEELVAPAALRERVETVLGSQPRPIPGGYGVHEFAVSGFATQCGQRFAQDLALGAVDGVLGWLATQPGCLALIYSEHGRSRAENRTGGTEPGPVGPAFLIGQRGTFGTEWIERPVSPADLLATCAREFQ